MILRLKNSRSESAEFDSGQSDFQLRSERPSGWIGWAPMIRFKYMNNRKWSDDYSDDFGIENPSSDHWNAKNYPDQRYTVSVSI